MNKIVSNIAIQKQTNMKKFYATTEQAEQIKGETKSCQCDCGQSYSIVLYDEIEVIICDACYENSSNIEQYL
jgi:hypothetical protein